MKVRVYSGHVGEQLCWVRRTEEGGMNSLCKLTESWVQKKIGMFEVGKW